MTNSNQSLVRLHLSSNEPVIDLNLPTFGPVKVRCVGKFLRAIPTPNLIALTLLDGKEKPIFESAEQVLCLLRPIEIHKITISIQSAMQEISPDANRMGGNHINEYRDKLKEGLRSFVVEAFKLSLCDRASDYFGISLCELSDSRFLLHQAAKDIYNADSRDKKNS